MVLYNKCFSYHSAKWQCQV